MQNWMTIVGSRPIAALNTFWHYLNEHPEAEISKFIMFYDFPDDTKLDWILQNLEILYVNYRGKKLNTELIKYDQQEVESFRSAVKKILYQSKKEVLIDMTSGRKAHSAILLLMGEFFRGQVKSVYYNFVRDAAYLNYPLPALPPGVFKIINMLEKE